MKDTEPTCLTVRQSIFQEEWVVSKQLATISTQEAFWMKVLANSIQAILQKQFTPYFKTSNKQIKCKLTFTSNLILKY